jgi:hypothetical protein
MPATSNRLKKSVREHCWKQTMTFDKRCWQSRPARQRRSLPHQRSERFGEELVEQVLQGHRTGPARGRED